MTPRKKKGVAAFISGALFVVMGIVFVAADATPDILGQVFVVIGLIADALGFKIVFPDTEE